jgi:hypothetical protein
MAMITTVQARVKEKARRIPGWHDARIVLADDCAQITAFVGRACLGSIMVNVSLMGEWEALEAAVDELIKGG